MNGEYDEEHESSSDEDDGERDGTDAVQDGCCQHPVFLHLVVRVLLVALLLVGMKSTPKEIANLAQ